MNGVVITLKRFYGDPESRPSEKKIAALLLIAIVQQR